MVDKNRPLAKFIVSHVRVKSEKKKVDFRDQVVAWGTSAIATLLAFSSSLIKLISSILDAIADYLLPYLQQVPRQDRPLWLAAAAFLGMGLIVLNKRRLSGPYNLPPVQPPAGTPVQPPPPAGTADTSKSAF